MKTERARKAAIQLSETVKQYPRLPKQKQVALRTWASSAGDFFLTGAKFVSGCITGSGFLCVSALYSFLMGFAKRQFVEAEKRPERLRPDQRLCRMGIFVLLAGVVYGVYLGRLILWPEVSRWTLPVCLLIALYSFIDVGISAYLLFRKDDSGAYPPLLLGRKLIGLACALPMLVMTQISLNGIANPQNTSLFDGVFGAVIGFIILGIGAGMIIYARRNTKSKERQP